MNEVKNVHNYRNTKKMLDLSSNYYEEAYKLGVMGLYADFGKNRNVTTENNTYVDFTRCSYLGLDSHPKIVERSIEAIRKYHAVQWSCARTRLNYNIIKDLEEQLSKLFFGHVVCFSSVTLANACILPLLASGAFTNDNIPTIVYDKLCHASLSLFKAVLADETKVITIPHNDLERLEEICKRHGSVVYIADGIYSMGGRTPINELLELQKKYDLFLFIDDAHGISIAGQNGEGYIRTKISKDNKKIITAASLAKGFGASGGILILATQEQEKIVRRFGSTYAFSAAPSIAAVGAALGSAEVHASEELGNLQKQLKEIVNHFDGLIKTEHQYDNTPIRMVRVGDEQNSVKSAKSLMEEGFYVSSVFFPVVPRGKAAIRISLSSNHSVDDVNRICKHFGKIGLPVCL